MSQDQELDPPEDHAAKAAGKKYLHFNKRGVLKIQPSVVMPFLRGNTWHS